MQWQLGDGAGLPLFLFTQGENGHICHKGMVSSLQNIQKRQPGFIAKLPLHYV